LKNTVLNQTLTPVFSALKRYSTDEIIPFHVPGHKQGRGSQELTNLVGKDCLSIDLTCMEDLDNICNPISVIKESEALAADLYGAENAYFLVNGTTSGIQTMILSVCEPGDKIIIPRNAHKSAIGGIILSGAEPVYIEPAIDDRFGIAMGVSPESVANALEIHPDAKAVFIINPTYYGIASDLKAIVDIAHNYEVPVIVDEAHGAHLKFGSTLPLSAMEAGADLAASSTHKLGGSLTQSSLLLHQGSLINPRRIKTSLNLTQTTSPSYILLASLDIARRQLALEGEEMIERTCRHSVALREQIRKIKPIRLLDDDILNQPGCYALDPTKIVLNFRALGLSGYEAEKILRKKYRIQPELSDLHNIILLVTIGDDDSTLGHLLTSLKDMAKGKSSKNHVQYFIQPPAIPDAVMSPRDAFYGETKAVLLNEAEGEISAEMIMAYPPGIPIICPGERINQDVIDYVNVLKKEAAELQGTEDPGINYIKVQTKRLVLLQNEENYNKQAM